MIRCGIARAIGRGRDASSHTPSGRQRHVAAFLALERRQGGHVRAADRRPGVGRRRARGPQLSAETDYKLSAEIYSYSKTKALFAGINLAGTKWEIDSKANKAVYGESRSADVKGLLATGGTGGPGLVQPFLNSLQKNIGPLKP